MNWLKSPIKFKVMNTKNYTAPVVEEFDINAEGVLCQSSGSNESYSGDPSDSEIIF
jgi:hypothetical protein